MLTEFYIDHRPANRGGFIVSKSSYILGDPPPDPRFLASLGARSLVTYNSITALTAHPGPKDMLVSHRISWGILQTPVFSLRSTRGHWYSSITALTAHPGPKDMLVSHRISWGILPQTPVFSLRSARCLWYISITEFTNKSWVPTSRNSVLLVLPWFGSLAASLLNQTKPRKVRAKRRWSGVLL
jgi:hypothetical protein